MRTLFIITLVLYLLKLSAGKRVNSLMLVQGNVVRVKKLGYPFQWHRQRDK